MQPEGFESQAGRQIQSRMIEDRTEAVAVEVKSKGSGEDHQEREWRGLSE